MGMYTKEKVLEIMMSIISGQLDLDEYEKVELSDRWQDVCDSLNMTEVVLGLNVYYNLQNLRFYDVYDISTFQDLYDICLEELRKEGKLLE